MCVDQDNIEVVSLQLLCGNVYRQEQQYLLSMFEWKHKLSLCQGIILCQTSREKGTIKNVVKEAMKQSIETFLSLNTAQLLFVFQWPHKIVY
jgi:hypothetical protein